MFSEYLHHILSTKDHSVIQAILSTINKSLKIY